MLKLGLWGAFLFAFRVPRNMHLRNFAASDSMASGGMLIGFGIYWRLLQRARNAFGRPVLGLIYGHKA